MNIRICILSMLGLAMATFLLIHFGLILIYGRFLIYESNLLVLMSEITMTISIMVFSFYCLVKEIQKR